MLKLKGALNWIVANLGNKYIVDKLAALKILPIF